MYNSKKDIALVVIITAVISVLISAAMFWLLQTMANNQTIVTVSPDKMTTSPGGFSDNAQPVPDNQSVTDAELNEIQSFSPEELVALGYQEIVDSETGQVTYFLPPEQAGAILTNEQLEAFGQTDFSDERERDESPEVLEQMSVEEFERLDAMLEQ